MVEPATVEAFMKMSYFVLCDSDVRVYEVVLAGTVTAANKHNRNQKVKVATDDIFTRTI